MASPGVAHERHATETAPLHDLGDGVGGPEAVGAALREFLTAS